MPDVLAVPLQTPMLAGGAPLYVTGEEALQLSVFNSVTGVTVALSGRFLAVKQRDDEEDPLPKPFLHALVPTTNRVATLRTETLGEGWILDGAVQVTAGTPLTGNTYAIVALVRGAKGALTTLSVLAQGYITSNQRLSLDGNVMQAFTDGAGALRSITGTTPAAGAEISETVPPGARWELQAFKALLTTSATAANRVPNLTIDDGVNVFGGWPTPNSITASLASTISWGPGYSQALNANSSFAPASLPTLWRLGAGFRIRTNTNALQVGDQYSAIQYLVREWLEG